MTTIEKNILETYLLQIEKLSSYAKIEIIERLLKSLKKEKDEEKERERKFFASAGGFGSSKPSDEIIKEIKASRHFRKREVDL